MADPHATPRERFLALAVLEAAVLQMYLADKETTGPSTTLHGPAFVRQIIRPSSIRFERVQWLTPTSWWDTKAAPYAGTHPLSADEYLRAITKLPSRLVFESEEEAATIIPFREKGGDS